MTTSLGKGPIPEYNPNNDYFTPRQVPRVKKEAQDNYFKNRGSLDMTLQNTNYVENRPVPRVKYDVAEKSYIKNRGCMNHLLTGYPDPSCDKKGPRISSSGQSNYIKNRGTFSSIIDQNNNHDQAPVHVPKVYYEGRNNRAHGNGSVGSLFSHYGHLPQSARPVPRVKWEASNNYQQNRGSSASKTLSMVPQSARPSSATFFDMKPR